MLVKELIVRHIGPHGALHLRGIRLSQTQVPPGVRVHEHGDDADDGDDAAGPVAGDLLLVRAPAGAGLREHVDTDLPVGASLALLLEVEVAELPVGRVLAALAFAKLQVLEAAVLSGTASAMVAVVATRSDELVAPAPYLAHDLEPGNLEGPAVLRRVLGEHALEGLVQRARERSLLAQVGDVEARLKEVASELELLHADRREHEATLVRDLATVGKELATARRDLDTERAKSRSLRSSTSFKVASRLARVARFPRRIVRRLGSGKARG